MITNITSLLILHKPGSKRATPPRSSTNSGEFSVKFRRNFEEFSEGDRQHHFLTGLMMNQIQLCFHNNKAESDAGIFRPVGVRIFFEFFPLKCFKFHSKIHNMTWFFIIICIWNFCDISFRLHCVLEFSRKFEQITWHIWHRIGHRVTQNHTLQA